MRRTSSLLFLTSLLLLLFYQHTLSAQATGSISGTINTSDAGALTNVFICVNTFDTDQHIQCRGDEIFQPGPNTYSFTGLETGTYRINISAQNYANEFYNNTFHFNSATAVSVTAPNDTPNINFVLDPAGSISGTINTSDAGALTNVFICVNTFDTNEHIQCRGDEIFQPGPNTYTFTGVPTGTYRVNVSALNYVNEFYNDTLNFDSATAVSVTAPNDMPNINFVLDPAGTISGTVYAANGTTPLANVPVDTSTGGYGRCTDVDGHYLLENLPLNTPLIIKADDQGWPGCTGSGFLTEWWEEATTRDAATPITLTSGANQFKTNTNFTLDVGGSISGVVTTIDGTTVIPDAEVCVHAYDESQFYDCYLVNAVDGSYSVSGLPTGSYRVEASAPHKENELYPETPFYQQAASIQVTAPATTPDINFTLAPGGAISGIITGVNLPLPGGTMCVNSYDSIDHVRCRGTDVINLNTGEFFFDHLPSGVYRVDISVPGYILEYYNGVWDRGDATAIEVFAPADVTGIVFNLDLAGGVSGVVYEADNTTPIPGAKVCVSAYTTGFYQCTDADPVTGAYSLQTLRTGNYRLSAYKQGFAITYYPNTPYYDLAQPVSVTVGQMVSNLNFTLAPGGSISGTINASDSGTLGSVLVCLNDFASGQHVMCRQGIFVPGPNTYTLDNIATGSYRVNVWATNYREQFYNLSDYSNATAVNVTAPNDTPNINFVLEPAGTISGTVYASDGTTPLANVPVDISTGGYGRCTDSAGHYLLDNLPLNTPFIIQAGGRGWPGCFGPNFLREWWQEASTLNDATAITLTEGANQFETGINFTLQAGGSISGHVTDGTTGLQNANVCIQVHIFGEGFGCFPADAGGNFSITGLPTGNYRLDISSQGYATEIYDNKPYYGDHGQATAISVTAGANTSLPDIVLALGGSLSGTVYAADGTTPLSYVPVGVFWGGFNQCTDINGNFTITNLPRNVPITLWAGGAVPPWMFSPTCNSADYIKEWWETVPDAIFDDAEPITLTDTTPNATGLTFKLDLGGTVYGVVTGTNGGGSVRVRVGYMGDDYGYPQNGPMTCTSPDGTYAISGVQLNQPFIVTAGYSGDCGNPHGYANEWWSEGVTYPEATHITLTEAVSAVAMIDFTLEVGGFITGTVTDSVTGLPLVNMPVLLRHAWYGVCTDADGHYTLEHVAPNTDLFVSSGGTVSFCGSPTPYAEEQWQEGVLTPIVVASGETVTGIDFTLSLPPTLVVTLLTPPTGAIMNDSTPTFTWEGVTDARRYRLQIDDSADFGSPTLTQTVTPTNFTLTAPLPSGVYFWRAQVQLDGAAEWSDWSAPWSFTIDMTRPAKPVHVQPENGAVVIVQPLFGWNAVADAVSYKIQVDDASDFTSPLYTQDTTELTFAPPTALADDVWYWRVQAFDAAGNKSAWTTGWSVRVDTVVAQTTTLLTPVNGFVTRARAATYTWQAVDGAKKYRLQVSTLPDFSTLLVNVTTRQTNNAPTIVLPKGTLYWRVNVQAADGLWSDWSSVFTLVIDRTAPAVPTLLTPANRAIITDTDMPIFDWADNGESDLARYVIQIDNNRNFSSPLLTVEVTASSYTSTLNLSNRAYYWRMRAIDQVNNQSPWSEQRKFSINVLRFRSLQ